MPPSPGALNPSPDLREDPDRSLRHPLPAPSFRCRAPPSPLASSPKASHPSSSPSPSPPRVRRWFPAIDRLETPRRHSRLQRKLTVRRVLPRVGAVDPPKPLAAFQRGQTRAARHVLRPRRVLRQRRGERQTHDVAARDSQSLSIRSPGKAVTQSNVAPAGLLVAPLLVRPSERVIERGLADEVHATRGFHVHAPHAQVDVLARHVAPVADGHLGSDPLDVRRRIPRARELHDDDARAPLLLRREPGHARQRAVTDGSVGFAVRTKRRDEPPRPLERAGDVGGKHARAVVVRGRRVGDERGRVREERRERVGMSRVDAGRCGIRVVRTRLAPPHAALPTAPASRARSASIAPSRANEARAPSPVARRPPRRRARPPARWSAAG